MKGVSEFTRYDTNWRLFFRYLLIQGFVLFPRSDMGRWLQSKLYLYWCK